MVTKSGSNGFHGMLYEYFRNDHLNTRNFFAAGKPPFKRISSVETWVDPSSTTGRFSSPRTKPTANGAASPIPEAWFQRTVNGKATFRRHASAPALSGIL